MAHRFAIALLIAFAACAPPPITASVPFGATDQAAIVVVDRIGQSTAYAVDKTKRDEMPVLARIDKYDGDAPIRVTAFLFEMPLESLNLKSGEIPDAADDPHAVSISGMREIAELSIDHDGAGDWAPVEQPTGAASTLKLPSKKPCISLGITRLDLDAQEPYLAGLVSLTATSALTAVYADNDDREATFYELSATRATRLDTRIANFTPRAMVRARDGKIYISGGQTMVYMPQIWAGDPTHGFELVVPDGVLQPLGWVWSMAVPTDPSDRATFYGITEVGQLVRFEDNQWQLLAMITADSGAEAQIAVAGRDDLYAIAPDGRALYRYHDAMLTEEQTPVTPDLRNGVDHMTGVGVVDGYGVFSGSASGYIMHLENGAWRQINNEPLIAEIDIHAWAKLPNEALVIGGAYGSLQQFYPEWGLCIDEGDVTFISNTATVNRLVSWSGGLFAAGIENLTRTSRIIYAAAIHEIPR